MFSYVSEDISERLFSIFRDVETKILKLKRENQLSKYDGNVSRNNQLELEVERIEEKDELNFIKKSKMLFYTRKEGIFYVRG